VTRDEATRLISRYHDALNAHDVDTLTGFYAEDAVVVSPIFSILRGRTAIRESFGNLFRLAPDYQVEPDPSLFIFEGARAADINTVKATYSEHLLGLPPTGHRIEYQIVRLITFRGAEIVHEQRLYDLAAVLERLEKARIDDELKVAGDIQRALLPRIHHRGPYFEAIGASRPSRSIGGDFFEYVDLPSGAFGLALGDVSGKGPAAALLAAMIQGMFSVDADLERSPSATLAHMNRALVRRRIEPRFATLVFGVLAPDGMFDYANAGHLPPLVVRRSGGIERLSTGGPLLGVFEEVLFPGNRCQLRPGDTVVAFSDGVTEAPGAGDDLFGEERLLAAADAHRLSKPAVLVDALFSAVRSFSGERTATDDVTITALQYL
jgi:serine phosphatase RsbU (regulator of sigma subunit)